MKNNIHACHDCASNSATGCTAGSTCDWSPITNQLGHIQCTLGKMRRKDYEDNTVDTSPLLNYYHFTKIGAWQRGLATNLDNPMYHLCGDNRKIFRALFGKPTFTYNGEFYFHCWLVILDEHTQLVILTARGKGTCYEAVTRSHGETLHPNQDKIIAFLTQLAQHMPRRT